MSEDTDTTQWSLPGPAEAPRDDLKMQLEVYKETILLRGFDGDSAWVRTVSADEIANVFTQHLGFSSGLLPKETLWWNQGETGQVVALWRPPQVWPVALQREAFKPPARLRAAHAGAGLRLLAGPCALGLRGNGPSDRRRAASLPGPGLQRSSATGGVCPGSHKFHEEVGLIPEGFFQSFFSLTGDTRNRSKKHPRRPSRTMGGDRWKDRVPDGGPCSPVYGGPGYRGLRGETGLPLAPERGRWATWSTTPAASPAPTESATTTFWDRAASTSSPGALT